MKSSESMAKIAGALVKAQKDIDSAKKDAKNPFFKSKYANLESVIDACKEALNTQGITILQPHKHESGRNFVETVLLHESGEWVSSETEVIVAKQNDPQALGSAISYARRYSLQSLVSIKAEDDDGETAQGRSYSTPVSAPTPKAVEIATTTTSAAPAESKPSSFKSRPKPVTSSGDAF